MMRNIWMQVNIAQLTNNGTSGWLRASAMYHCFADASKSHLYIYIFSVCIYIYIYIYIYYNIALFSKRVPNIAMWFLRPKALNVLVQHTS